MTHIPEQRTPAEFLAAALDAFASRPIVSAIGASVGSLQNREEASMTTTAEHSDQRAFYGCPDWCERTDHSADRVDIANPPVHYGPGFGLREPPRCLAPGRLLQRYRRLRSADVWRGPGAC